MNKQIVLERKGDIAFINVLRPEALNALSRNIIDEMDKLVDQVKNDPSIRVLLFYGEKHFAAGADIQDMVECDESGANAFSFTPTYDKIQALPIPTIAVMEGYAFGGGLELALRCDFRIATKTAMALPELNLGIIPGAGGTVLLPRLIGEAKAKELILMGRVVSGEEAERLNLVHIAVENDVLMSTAEEWAAKLCTRSRRSLEAAKLSIENGISGLHYQDATAFEERTWCNLFNYPDQKEGMRAFLEKRKPEFTHQ